MKILSLDCATKTGWCLLDDGKIIESGVQDFTKRRGDSNGMMFLRFRKWLDDLIAGFDPQLIVYEQSHHRGGAATEIGVNLTGRVQEVCAMFQIDFASVHTATLKKFSTGNGRAEKREIMDKAAIYLKREPIDDNEADAVMMALYANNEYGRG
jgi:Holliday junction resolvasome RuvABC endonuclease subunit